MNYIYALIDPLDRKIRYIGNTRNPEARYKQHLKEVEKRCKTEKQKWIRSLLDNKLKPLMRIMHIVEDEAQARLIEEKEVIKHLKTVLNIHLPGKGSRDIAYFKKTGRKH